MATNKSNTLPFRSQSALASRNTKVEKFVIALFNYDSNRDSQLPAKGLSFSFGDVLHVTNASDSHWWYAKHVFSLVHVLDGDSPGFTSCNDNCSGVIPSKSLVERRNKKRNMRVNFSSKNLVIGNKIYETDVLNACSGDFVNNANTTESIDMAEKKSKSIFAKYLLGRNNKSGKNAHMSNSLENLKDLTYVYCGSDILTLPKTALDHSYVEAEQVYLSQRPIVILGPVKELIVSQLVGMNESLVRCPINTTKKELDKYNETSNFIYSSDIEKLQLTNGGFIEMSDKDGEFYGIHYSNILQIIEDNKFPVLGLSLAGLKRLKMNERNPIVILAIPENEVILRKLCPELTEDMARQELSTYDSILDTQALTSSFRFKTFESCMYKIKYILRFQLNHQAWVPNLGQLNLGNLISNEQPRLYVEG